MVIHIFQNIMAKLVGADVQLLNSVPLDERSQINNAGLASLAGVSFQLLCVCVGCAGFIRPDNPTSYAITGIATAAVTSVVYFFDRAMIAAHFRQAGEDYCVSEGLMVRRGSLWKKLLAISARFGLSMALAFSLAYPVLLTFFGPEVNGELLRASREANANLFRAVAVKADEKLALSALKVEKLNKQLEIVMGEQKALVEFNDPNTAKAPLIKELESLRKTYSELEDEKANAQSDADAEEFGQKLKANHTGKIGTGSAYKFHMARVTDAAERLKEIKPEIDKLTNKIEALNSSALINGKLTDQNVIDPVSATEKKVETAQQRLNDALNEKSDLTDGRAAWINENAALDSAFVPPAEGLLERIKALFRLIGNDASLLSLVLLVKLVIMSLEAAGPLVAWLFLPPGIYCMKVALRMRDAVSAELDRNAEASFEREQKDALHNAELNGYRRRRSAQDQVYTEFETQFQKRAANA